MSKKKLRAEIARLKDEMWQLRYENARLRYRLDGQATTGYGPVAPEKRTR